MWGIGAITLALPSSAVASDTVTYTYDARGRLIRVQHSGGPAAGVDKRYTYDKADNRSRVQISGATVTLSASAATNAPGNNGHDEP